MKLLWKQRPRPRSLIPGTFSRILIGRELAKQLRWCRGCLHIINPIGGSIGNYGNAGTPMFVLSCWIFFTLHVSEYDTKWTYVEINQAQKFLKLGDAVNGIEMILRNIDEAPLMSTFVSKALEYPFYVRHWMGFNAQLFSALKLEKIVMGLIFSPLRMVASPNIAGTS